MKTLLVVAIAALSFAHMGAAQTGAGTPARTSEAVAPGGCEGCAQKAGGVVAKLVPGTNETVLVGRVENLIPIAVLTTLGCETCVSKAVAWALQQGSSPEDVDRALRAVGQMQTLDCFKQQFGQDAAARLEKPLAAARKVLQEAMDRGREKQASREPIGGLKSVWRVGYGTGWRHDHGR